MRFIDADAVRARLTYARAIPLMRAAMSAFSAGETRQLLRAIIPLADGRAFGVMPGAMGERAAFGAKLVSVFPENFADGRSSHQGVVVLFDGEDGAPVCVVDAAAITEIRTAAASAAATDALARVDARRLALLGYGEQARSHARAIAHVRPLEAISVWGRSPKRARAYADRMSAELGLPVEPRGSVAEAVRDADIVCTLTAAREPILHGRDTPEGAHVNVVGSSYAGPAEIDVDLVARARFVADSREGVLAQGAEFLRAKAAGRVDDTHVVAEIGEVFLGRAPGRASPEQVTIYKSLGHVVQDLAAASALLSDPVGSSVS